MSVHSVLLGTNESLGTGSTTIYTAPSTKRAIVKFITVQNKAATPTRVAVLLYNGATLLARFNLYVGLANSSGDTVLVPVWIVVTENYHVEAAATQASVSISLSGTELQL